MRQSVAAFAICRRTVAGETLWLAQWNANWKRFNLVGGHRRADESFRDCAIREIAEELSLVEGTDFTVREQPMAHLQYVAWSFSANEDTSYLVELFEALLLRDEARQKINSNPLNVWLSRDEIASGQTSDGQPISETIKLMLAKARLWPADESQANTDIDSTDSH